VRRNNPAACPRCAYLADARATRHSPQPPPHPRPPALHLPSVPDHAVIVADEVRLGLDRRHDERDAGLGERVAELLLLPAQQLGQLRIP
jgi:hypothetical protein